LRPSCFYGSYRITGTVLMIQFSKEMVSRRNRPRDPQIAPYSSGIITFEIPFDKIRPFLTDEAKTLLP